MWGPWRRLRRKNAGLCQGGMVATDQNPPFTNGGDHDCFPVRSVACAE